MSKKWMSAGLAAMLVGIAICLAGCGEQKKNSLQLSADAANALGVEGPSVLAADNGQAQAPGTANDAAGQTADASFQANAPGEDGPAVANTPGGDGPAADAAIVDGENSANAGDQTANTASAPKRSYTAADYEAAGVNELNSVPILMYHRVYDMTNDETEYTGGNVDADGYNRTYEALEADLEMYYDMGYRCMRLTDYIDGNIDVEFGYSPVILTFDDGRKEAAIEGFDENGNPIFDPHSAIGVLERVKQRHPDFHVTATFFLNNFFFDDIDNYEDNVRVMKWLVNNGYDIGNHTMDHALLEDCTEEEIIYQVGGMYKLLEEAIPGQYVNIVALPYGSPTDFSADPKYQSILSGTYDGFTYYTKGALLCAWTRAYSPFVTEWDPTYIRRIRGYDNNGEDFDIEFNFEQLNAGRRYISDGDPDTVVIRADEEEDWLYDVGGREVIRY